MIETSDCVGRKVLKLDYSFMVADVVSRKASATTTRLPYIQSTAQLDLISSQSVPISKPQG
jgi:hypothetical protein